MENLNIWKCFVLALYASVAQGWNNKDKVKLNDVNVLTLRNGQMTNGRRSSPVPQIKCVGGTAGCHAFVPNVVQCYNRGSDGYDVQWECKADMDNKYRFGEIVVNCEGYDYADDPHILKGSCGLEYTIDRVSGSNDDHGYNSGHRQSYHGNSYGHKKHHRKSGWMSSFIMWGVIAFIAYYIYKTVTTNGNTPDSTQSTYQSGSASAPPPGFRPEYTQEQSQYTSSTSSSTDNSNSNGGFWTGMGLGGVAGYLFGNSGYGNTGNNPCHSNPYYSQGNSWFGGNTGSWFGGNHGNNGWYNSNQGNSGWFGGGSGSSSGWSTTHRRSGSSSSPSSGSRTASGFGGTKRR